MEIDNLMDVFDPDGAQARTEKITVKNPAIMKKLAEEKKKRERELLKKKLAAAVDLVGDGDIEINQNKEKSILTELAEKIL